MDEFLQEDEPEHKFQDVDEDMLVDLAEGKKVGHMKLTKN